MKDLLTQLVSGGLAGALAWKLIERVPALAKLEDDLKRYVAMAMTALLGAAAYAASVAMLYDAMPVDWRGWIEGLVGSALAAYLASQSLHAATALRLKRQVRALKARTAALRK